jgi:hypothetical protein
MTVMKRFIRDLHFGDSLMEKIVHVALEVLCTRRWKKIVH